MRSEALGPLLLVVLAGCGGDTAPPRKVVAPPPPSIPEGQRVEITPGSRRALIYTWRDRFPREIQTDDSVWLLNDADYQKTKDFANAWKLLYTTKDGKKLIQVV